MMKQNFGRLGRATLLLLLLGLLLSFQPSLTPVVMAHANVIRSEPAQNSVLEEFPPVVTIWFTEPLAPEFGGIEVLASDGRPVDNGDSAVDSRDPTVMSVSLPPLPNGTYVVDWTNVSTVDGHKVRGSFLFSVGEPLSAASLAGMSGQSLLQSPFEPPLRWLTLLGVLAAVGGLVFERLIWRPVWCRAGATETLHQLGERLAARTLKFTWLALGLALAASLGHLSLQTTITYELPLSQIMGRLLISILLGTSWGFFLLWRLGLLLVLPAVLDLTLIIPAGGQPPAGRQRLLRRLASAVTIVASVGILLSLSLTSHAAATAGLRLAAVFNDYLHLVAASFWVGGLFLFALSLPLIGRSLSGSQRREVLAALAARFSKLAGLSVAILIITGLYSAWAQVTILPAMATPYGQALLAKLGLMAAILGLAAFNLLWVRPRLARQERAGQWLRRLVAAEAILALLLLLPVALLIALEPARQVASREGLGQERGLNFQETIEGTDLRLEIEPGQVGPNRFLVSLKDRRGRPISNASDVSLRATYLGADLGESPLSATAGDDGQYLIEDLPLTIAGPWQVELVVRRPDAFDARTAFRFEVLPGAALSSAAIAPAPETGQRLWGAELALLGLLLIGAGLPLTGWRTRPGRAVAWSGLIILLASIFLAVNTRFFKPDRPEIALAAPLAAESGSAAAAKQVKEASTTGRASLRNPFPPNPASLATGQRVFEQNCTSCHGLTGRGDGLLAEGLPIPPADLLTHIPLHADIELFRIVRDGKTFSPMPSFVSVLTTDEIWHLVNYLRVFKVDQSLAEDHYQAGLEFAQAGDDQQALASLDEALKLSPKHALAHNLRGTILSRLGKLEQAIAAHSRAIELKPDFAEAHFNRAVDQHAARNLDQAILDYGQAIDLEPGHPDPYYARGLAYVEAGDLKQAIPDFDQALELYPDYTRIYLDRGQAHYNLGHLEQALSDLEQYLKRDPEAVDRQAVANMVAQLQAGLSPARAAPTTTGAGLTLADFPPGFEAIPPAELGLVEGEAIGRGPTIERSFAFGERARFELVWGFTAQMVAAEVNPTSTDLLALLKQGLGEAAIQEHKDLPRPADLGNASVGLTALVAAGDLRTRVDGLAFRQGTRRAYLFMMYADGEDPALSLADLARKLHDRLGPEKLSTASP